MKRINLLVRLQNILVLLAVSCVCACKKDALTESRRQEQLVQAGHITLSSLDENSPDSLWEQFFAQYGMRRMRGHLFLCGDKPTPLFRGKFGATSITDAKSKEAIMGFIKYLHYRNMTMRSINIERDVLYELDQAIIEFAATMEQFTYLESLTIHNNHIKDMTTLIAALPNLKELCLDNNNLCQLPDEISLLTKLEKLHVTDNQLYELPNSITRLTSLTELDLSNNMFERFPLLIDTPKSISIPNDNVNDAILVKKPLIKLKVLFFKNNYIQEIPDCIDSFTNLEKIYLDGNRIRKLPHTIAQLTKLSRLVLAQNQLKELPACMYPFMTLGQLNIRQNNWYKKDELDLISYGDLKKEAQKMLPSSLSALCMRCIVGPVESLSNRAEGELEGLLPVGLSYKYFSHTYQQATNWKEGAKYVCFIPLGKLNIPLSMDFSFVTLADLDNLVEKIIKKSKAKIVFQKKEQNF
jgi:hypothetical protein